MEGASWRLRGLCRGSPVACLVLVLVACAPRVDPELVATVRPFEDEQYWAIESEGRRIGWSGLRYEIRDEQDLPSVIAYRRSRIWMEDFGGLHEELELHFEPVGAGAVQRVHGVRRMGELEQEWTGDAVGPGRMRAKLRNVDTTDVAEVATPRESLRGYARLADWLAGSRSGVFVDHGIMFPFALDEPTDCERRMEFVREYGFSDGRPLFELTGTLDGGPARWVLYADGSTHRQEAGGSVLQHMTAAEAMAVHPAAMAVYTDLGDPTEVTRLELEWRGPGADYFPESAWQVVTPAADDTFVVTIRGGAAVLADPGPPVPLSDDARRRYTASERSFDYGSSSVAALARGLAVPEEPSLDDVRRLFGVVRGALEVERTDRHRTASEVAVRGRGDCKDFATLFVALARSRGIPTRYVHGLVYSLDTGPPAFSGHAWAEVWIDGRWLPVDPIFDQIPNDATHVTTGEGLRREDRPTFTLDVRVRSFERG